MSANLRAGLGTLLDQYDDTRRAAQARRDQVSADRSLFVQQFAELRRDVLRPVFEAAGALLRERGHEFSIQEEEFAAQAAGKTAEAGIVFRRTVSIRNGAVPYEGFAAGSRGAYPLAGISTQLVEEEVLKLMTALVKG